MDAYAIVWALIGGVLLGSAITIIYEWLMPVPPGAPPEDSAAHWADVDERRGKL